MNIARGLSLKPAFIGKGQSQQCKCGQEWGDCQLSGIENITSLISYTLVGDQD